MELMTQAAYATRVGVKKQALTRWKKRGWLVFEGDLVDVAASDAKVKKYRSAGLHVVDSPVSQPPVNRQSADASLTPTGGRNRPERSREAVASMSDLQLEDDGPSPAMLASMARLDRNPPAWTWDEDEQHQRAHDAAACVGCELLTSDLPYGHGNWGGYLVREAGDYPAMTDLERVYGGHGFQLRPWQVIALCRAFVFDGNEVVRPDLLRALAWPLEPWQGNDPITDPSHLWLMAR